MNIAGKLLRKIYITRLDFFLNLFHYKSEHYYYDTVLFSPFRMSGLAVRQVLLRNFCKNVSLSERLMASYHNLMRTVASFPAEQELNPGFIEPLLETYFSCGNSHQFPMFPSENLTCGNSVSTVALETSTCVENVVFLKRKYLADKMRYKKMRQWIQCKDLYNFEKETQTSSPTEFFVLKVLSFNILAQCLLETHPYLYKDQDERALSWKIRKQLLLEEILDAQANVICLQEMQEEHLQEFLIPFKELGYNYLYKKRTNDKHDGLLFLYRSDQLILMEYTKVEFYQSGIKLLNRDNVGIIAKLAVKEDPETQLVIATTHLLYNPRRNDVRLVQTQLLLAEIERIAFLENTVSGAKYLPIILAGDFNLEPDSGVYRFIVHGKFVYRGNARNLKYPRVGQTLSNYLMPPRLFITDNCQHFNILKHRLLGQGSAKVMLENSEHLAVEATPSADGTSNYCEVNTNTTDAQTIQIVHGYRAKFSSGTLTHPFNFRSVYKHEHRFGREATTKQDDWITVDYIFYNGLELVERYRLPTVRECNTLPNIPNLAVGSDHFCLGATFKIYKKKR